MKVGTEVTEQSGDTGAAKGPWKGQTRLVRCSQQGLAGTHAIEWALPRAAQSWLCSATGSMKGSAWEEVRWAGGRRAGFMREA